eukprot:jgi/Mesvir1/11624/Mv00028-RA.1
MGQVCGHVATKSPQAYAMPASAGPAPASSTRRNMLKLTEAFVQTDGLKRAAYPTGVVLRTDHHPHDAPSLGASGGGLMGTPHKQSEGSMTPTLETRATPTSSTAAEASAAAGGALAGKTKGVDEVAMAAVRDIEALMTNLTPSARHALIRSDLTILAPLVSCIFRRLPSRKCTYLASPRDEIDREASGYLWALISKLRSTHGIIMVPLHVSAVTGTGLLPALSRAMWGVEVFADGLRKRVHKELRTNKAWYLSQVSEEEFDTAYKEASRMEGHRSLLLVLAFANMLRRPIALHDTEMGVQGYGMGITGTAGVFGPMRLPLQDWYPWPLSIAWKNERHNFFVPLVYARYPTDIKYPEDLMSTATLVASSALKELVPPGMDHSPSMRSSALATHGSAGQLTVPTAWLSQLRQQALQERLRQPLLVCSIVEKVQADVIALEGKLLGKVLEAAASANLDSPDSMQECVQNLLSIACLDDDTSAIESDFLENRRDSHTPDALMQRMNSSRSSSSKSNSGRDAAHQRSLTRSPAGVELGEAEEGAEGQVPGATQAGWQHPRSSKSLLASVRSALETPAQGSGPGEPPRAPQVEKKEKRLLFSAWRPEKRVMKGAEASKRVCIDLNGDAIEMLFDVEILGSVQVEEDSESHHHNKENGHGYDGSENNLPLFESGRTSSGQLLATAGSDPWDDGWASQGSGAGSRDNSGRVPSADSLVAGGECGRSYREQDRGSRDGSCTDRSTQGKMSLEMVAAGAGVDAAMVAAGTSRCSSSDVQLVRRLSRGATATLNCRVASMLVDEEPFETAAALAEHAVSMVTACATPMGGSVRGYRRNGSGHVAPMDARAASFSAGMGQKGVASLHSVSARAINLHTGTPDPPYELPPQPSPTPNIGMSLRSLRYLSDIAPDATKGGSDAAPGGGLTTVSDGLSVSGGVVPSAGGDGPQVGAWAAHGASELPLLELEDKDKLHGMMWAKFSDHMALLRHMMEVARAALDSLGQEQGKPKELPAHIHSQVASYKVLAAHLAWGSTRLRHELRLLREIPLPGVARVGATKGNIFHATALLKGPEGTPWVGGSYLLEIGFTLFYPKQAPILLRFLTPGMPHPCIDPSTSCPTLDLDAPSVLCYEARVDIQGAGGAFHDLSKQLAEADIYCNDDEEEEDTERGREQEVAGTLGHGCQQNGVHEQQEGGAGGGDMPHEGSVKLRRAIPKANAGISALELSWGPGKTLRSILAAALVMLRDTRALVPSAGCPAANEEVAALLRSGPEGVAAWEERVRACARNNEAHVHKLLEQVPE